MFIHTVTLTEFGGHSERRTVRGVGHLRSCVVEMVLYLSASGIVNPAYSKRCSRSEDCTRSSLSISVFLYLIPPITRNLCRNLVVKPLGTRDGLEFSELACMKSELTERMNEINAAERYGLNV
jgi:hypothetical protein